MMAEGSLDMSVPMDCQAGGDMFLIMHVKLRDGADKREVGMRLLSKSPISDQYIRTFSNLPGFLVWVFWTDSITEMREFFKATSEDKEVMSVILNFAYLERVYTTTWRDKLPLVRTRPSEKARTHKLHSGHSIHRSRSAS